MNMIQEEITKEEEDFIFESQEINRGEDYEALLALYEEYPIIIPEEGDVLTAIYQGISSDQFIFSVIGLKDDIRVETKSSESKYISNLEIGDGIDVLITNINEDVYLINGSICDLYESRAHESLRSMDKDEAVMATVKSINPAGYEVEVFYNGVVLAGFMPNTLAGINKLHDAESIIDETFDVMIESFSQREGTYIVSRKRYLQTLIPEQVELLEYNEVYSGYVTGTTKFGVFVEFSATQDVPNCLTGMVHKANLNTDWKDRMDEIQPGFEIDFYIKEVIKNNNYNNYKIILTQILRETLWDTIKGGQVMSGKIRDIKKFGALVNLDEETVGLVHISEIEKSGKSFEPGDDIDVKVISTDRSTRKIFLAVA